MLLLVAIRNVTARKAVERNLAGAALRSQSLLDRAPTALIVVNKRNRIVQINAAAQHMFGFEAADMTGQPATAVLPAELTESLFASHGADADGADAVADGWTAYRGNRKDGTAIAFEAAISTLKDGQGRVAIAAIRELDGGAGVPRARSGSLSGDVLQAAPDAIIVVDAGGEIVLLNAEAERRFGYSEAELIGQSAKRILPEGFIERLAPDPLRSAEVALAREIGTGIELAGLRRDGSRFPVELLLAPLERNDGPLWIATLRDLSVRRAAERHSVSSDESALALAARLSPPPEASRELQQFAYLVAHDLQEPLRMVASYTHLLAERYKGQLDSDADDFLGFAVDGAKRMQRLIADMLNYCRVDTTGMRLERLASGDILDQALLDLKAAVEESDAIVTHGDLPEVTSDRTQLLQLFQNLIGNAIKYRRPEAPAINVSAIRTPGGEWEFAVADNGIGIEPENVEKIFTMFHRLHRHDTIPGSGIGLAAARRIVERHGGRIWATSVPGTGSVFHFTLPDAGDV